MALVSIKESSLGCAWKRWDPKFLRRGLNSSHHLAYREFHCSFVSEHFIRNISRPRSSATSTTLKVVVFISSTIPPPPKLILLVGRVREELPSLKKKKTITKQNETKKKLWSGICSGFRLTCFYILHVHYTFAGFYVFESRFSCRSWVLFVLLWVSFQFQPGNLQCFEECACFCFLLWDDHVYVVPFPAWCTNKLIKYGNKKCNDPGWGIDGKC